MYNIAERAVIQYFHKKGLPSEAIHAELLATLGKDPSPSYATLKVGWQILSRKGLEDDPLQDGPVTVATPKIVTKVHDMVMGNRRVTESYIASAVGISQERVNSILTEDLDTRKLPARWEPRYLTIDQKHTRQNMSYANRICRMLI